MRIHIIPLGFRPEVFTNSYGPLLKTGADKIITLHTPIQNEEIGKKVDKTFSEIKRLFPTLEIDRVEVEATSFIGFVKEFIKMLNRFGDSDKIYVHIGGGQRHIGIALVYASFFSKKNILTIPVLEYGEDPKSYQYELIHPLTPVEITTAQKRILKLVAEKSGQTLRDIATRENAQKPQSVAPAILRHLRNLARYHLVISDKATNTYTATEIATLFL